MNIINSNTDIVYDSQISSKNCEHSYCFHGLHNAAYRENTRHIQSMQQVISNSSSNFL
ncbi:MAG: hypothetical protein R6T91_05685 [Bacteroidales bacterium]